MFFLRSAYLTADLLPDFEFQNKMGLSNFEPFDKIEPQHIAQIKFQKEDNDTLLDTGSVQITDRDSIRKYTVIEAVVFDEDLNQRDIEDLLPKLRQKDIQVAIPKYKSSIPVYKSIPKKNKL